MKIGLIARCEYARGIAIQSKNFYDHMPVERTLLVRMPEHKLDCDERPEWYPGATNVEYDALLHRLPEAEVREWLDGLDVVFTVETPNDWRLPDWAREQGVKTVIQGNPEFYRHDHEEYAWQAHPDAWWWPTPWRMDRLPPGRLVPVPMPDYVASNSRHHNDRPSYLHVVGKRAYADRNGTDIVINALRGIEEPCDVTISGFGWELPEITLPIGSPVNLTVERVGVPNRWDMYADQSVLVMPRRYGGLCLPALEAAACGLAVMMPNVSPNETLASILVDARDGQPLRLACGRIWPVDVDHMDLARAIDNLTRNPILIVAARLKSVMQVPRWTEMRQVYLDELAAVVG